MQSKIVILILSVNVFLTEAGWFKPFGPFGPFGPGGPYGPYGAVAPYGAVPSPSVQNPNATGTPWGSYGPWGPWGPYGPSAPYLAGRKKRSLYGLAMFAPYAGLQQQMISSKFNWVSSSVILKKQFKAITSVLNDELEVAQGDLENKLDVLNLNADRVVFEAEQAGRDISACVAALQRASDAISVKINALDIDASETELGMNITRDIGSLNAQIGKYGKVFKLCKAQFASFVSQMSDIQDCTTNQKDLLDQQTEDQKVAINQDISQLQKNIADLIVDVTADVEEQIQRAGDEFKACSS